MSKREQLILDVLLYFYLGFVYVIVLKMIWDFFQP